MPLLPVYNERSSFDLEITITDADGDPLVPTSAYYTVYDITGESEIKAWTLFSVDENGEATLTLSPADLAIVSSANEYEERSVVVTATYGASLEYNEEYKFRIKNLHVVPRV